MDNNNSVMAARTVTTTYVGPLPTADEFRQYNETLPGAAERMLQMAELEAVHRRECDAKLVDCAIKSDKRGQWFGFFVTLASLAVSCVFMFTSQPLAAVVPGLFGIANIVAVFLGQRNANPQK